MCPKVTLPEAYAGQVWFEEECDKLRPLWTSRLKQLEAEGSAGMTREELAEQFAKNAREDLLRLEAEIGLMVVRTAAILTAATLLFAVYAFKPSIPLFAGMLAVALCFAALGFVASLVPMIPPVLRAWFQRYERRHIWTLLVYDSFTSWVMDCYLGERRQDVITKYKRAHAIAVPVLVIAAVLIVGGTFVNALH